MNLLHCLFEAGSVLTFHLKIWVGSCEPVQAAMFLFKWPWKRKTENPPRIRSQKSISSASEESFGCVGYEHAVLRKVAKWLAIWLVSYPASFSPKFKLYLNNKSGEQLEYKPNGSDVQDSTPISHVF